MKKIAALFFALGVLVGCANPGIVKISPDTYLLAREAHGGVFASAAKLKAGVIRDANAFAARQGKVAVPISAKEKPMGSGPAQGRHSNTNLGLLTRMTQRFAEPSSFTTQTSSSSGRIQTRPIHEQENREKAKRTYTPSFSNLKICASGES